MEPALRAVCKDVRIGKILIQTNQDTGEPEVQNFQQLSRKQLEQSKYGGLFLFRLFSPMCHIWVVLHSAD